MQIDLTMTKTEILTILKDNGADYDSGTFYEDYWKIMAHYPAEFQVDIITIIDPSQESPYFPQPEEEQSNLPLLFEPIQKHDFSEELEQNIEEALNHYKNPKFAQIYGLNRQGIKQAELSKQFNLSQPRINHIIKQVAQDIYDYLQSGTNNWLEVYEQELNRTNYYESNFVFPLVDIELKEAIEHIEEQIPANIQWDNSTLKLILQINNHNIPLTRNKIKQLSADLQYANSGDIVWLRQHTNGKKQVIIGNFEQKTNKNIHFYELYIIK